MLPTDDGAAAPPATLFIEQTETPAPPDVQVAPGGILPSTPPPEPVAAVETPAPAVQLVQLTSGGCCVSPAWSPDGSQVWYIDKPSPESPAGLWGVGVDGSGPFLVTERLGVYSPDRQLIAYPENGVTYVERLSTGERWTVSNGGRAVSFSPDSAWITWSGGQSGPPFDTARRELWLSRFDGTGARLLLETTGGGLAGWLPDGRMIVTGRDGGETIIWITGVTGENPEPLSQGSLFEMVRAERLRGISISPGGSWMAYTITFSEDPQANGIWVLDIDTRQRRKLSVFGAFRWRDDGRLLVVPMELDQPSHRLLQVDAATGEVTALTDSASLSFKIANGDWTVSPDGSKAAFVSAFDNNIWMLLLP